MHAVDSASTQFEVHANQYTSAIRDANNALKEAAKATTESGTPGPEVECIRSFLPVKCTYPNTPRWNTKPKVKAYSTVLISGFLTGCEMGDKNTKPKFTVDIETVTLLGRVIPEAPRVAASPGESFVTVEQLHFDVNQL